MGKKVFGAIRNQYRAFTTNWIDEGENETVRRGWI